MIGTFESEIDAYNALSLYTLNEQKILKLEEIKLLIKNNSEVSKKVLDLTKSRVYLQVKSI